VQRLTKTASVRNLSALAALGMLASCMTAGPTPQAAALPTRPAVCPAVSDHVVIVSLDGMRPDAIDAFRLRTLQRLALEGSRAEHAETVMPSFTLPSHVSMLTGVSPAVHGITWNDDRTREHGFVSVPTVFQLATAAGLRAAAFFSKSKFHHLRVPGTLDYAPVPDGGDLWLATRTMAEVLDYIAHERPNLLFVHVADTDYAGHAFGWMSTPYRWAARRMDSTVRTLVRAADRAYGAGNYTLIVTADHGGHGRAHGTADPQDVAIPWIAWGRGVQRGAISDTVRTTDTAATVLWLLGLASDSAWEGRVVRQAFGGDAAHCVRPD
jgi:predicted AlkP superfamily pyrophosphatase or phosphodiesterase